MNDGSSKAGHRPLLVEEVPSGQQIKYVRPLFDFVYVDDSAATTFM